MLFRAFNVSKVPILLTLYEVPLLTLLEAKIGIFVRYLMDGWRIFCGCAMNYHRKSVSLQRPIGRDSYGKRCRIWVSLFAGISLFGNGKGCQSDIAFTGNNNMHLKNFSLYEVADKMRLTPAYELLNAAISILRMTKSWHWPWMVGKKTSKRGFYQVSSYVGYRECDCRATDK